MKLARMQDIGGLRAVVGNMGQVRKLEMLYRDPRWEHELKEHKNYIDRPKEDGYRSVHLIFRYSNDRADPCYSGLSIELQIRTRFQHAWATAVETMGTFLGQALKAGGGENQWREYFVKASAAIAVLEETSHVPGFEGVTQDDIFQQVATTEQSLQVLPKLSGFAIAASGINAERGRGAYHLVVLDSGRRTVSIRPYPRSRLEQANEDYSQIEGRTKAGEPIEAVLVSAGGIDALRKAYPNYFLDTQEFAHQIRRVIETVRLAGIKKSESS